MSPNDLSQRPVRFQSAGQHHFGVRAPTVLSSKATLHALRRAHVIPTPDNGTQLSISRYCQLADTNIGYQLLRKAGWQAGTGLGVSEQGRFAPVELASQAGNQGIGYTTVAAPGSKRRRGAPDADGAGSRRDSSSTGDVGSATDGAAAATEADAARAARAAGLAASQAKVAALVAAELAKEDTNTKVLRQRQVARQEREDARAKAIRQYIFRAFNDPFDSRLSDESNVLSRSSRLTATNPLLD